MQQVLRVHVMKRWYAGHNKWSKVKHIKGDKDLLRGQLFSRISKQIVAAIKAMNGELDSSQNHYLAAALHAAKGNQMPKSTIEAAIKRATSKKEAGEELKPVTFMGIHGSSGCAVIVETLGSNSAKTNAEIRLIFKKHNAAISKVDFLFEKKGRIIIRPADSGKSFQEIEDLLLESEDVEDFVSDLERGTIQVDCSIQSVYKLQNELASKGIHIVEWTTGYVPNSNDMVEVSKEEIVDEFRAFKDALENHEDVVQVITNTSL